MTVRTSESPISGPGYDPPQLEAMGHDGETLRCTVKPLSESAAILSLAGDIDLSTADGVSHCFQLLADQELSGVLIDATAVTFMDSSGLHALIEGKRLMHDLDCGIVLVPSPQVRRLLEIALTDPLFVFQVDNLEDGLAVLNSSNS